MHIREETSCSLVRYTRQRPSFLDRVQKFLKWSPIEALLTQGFGERIDAAGVLGYPALKMFKILLLQLWYTLSDREVYEALFDRNSFHRFTGSGLKDNTPHIHHN